MSKRCFKVIHDFQRTMMWVFPNAPKNFKHDGLKDWKDHRVVLTNALFCYNKMVVKVCRMSDTCSPIIMEVEITQACKGNVLVLEGSHFTMIMDAKVLTGILRCFCFHYNPWESMRILPRNSSWGQDFVVSSPIQWRSDESQPGEGWQILGLMRWIQGKGSMSIMHRLFSVDSLAYDKN